MDRCLKEGNESVGAENFELDLLKKEVLALKVTNSDMFQIIHSMRNEIIGLQNSLQSMQKKVGIDVEE